MPYLALLDRFGDPVLALALAAGWVIGVNTFPATDAAVAAPLGIACALTVAVRRRAPLASFVVMLVLFQANIAVAPAYAREGMAPLVVFLLGLYSLGRNARGLETTLGGVGVGFAIAVVAAQDGDFSVGGMAFYVALCCLPWGIGISFRLRIDRVRELQERNDALREQAERAVTEERARIARELHDVVSHAIAVTVLQARGGAKMLGRDGRAVLNALHAIEQTNTAALADMRRLLELLRNSDAEAGARDEPAPSLDRIDRLLDGVRESGLPVDLTVSGDPLPVPPGLDLSAYRIVQEALTNVLKHAGPGARARVEVHYGAAELTVAVDNTGRGRADQPAGTTAGHGLLGIRERVAVAGGAVEAGPTDDGYAVHARLPYLLTLQTRVGATTG